MGSYARQYERAMPRPPQPGVSKALDNLRHRPRAPLADAPLNAPPPMPTSTTIAERHQVEAVMVEEEDLGGASIDDPTAEDLAVRVAVRARPLVAKERLERARECLAYPSLTLIFFVVTSGCSKSRTSSLCTSRKAHRTVHSLFPLRRSMPAKMS